MKKKLALLLLASAIGLSACSLTAFAEEGAPDEGVVAVEDVIDVEAVEGELETEEPADGTVPVAEEPPLVDADGAESGETEAEPPVGAEGDGEEAAEGEAGEGDAVGGEAAEGEEAEEPLVPGLPVDTGEGFNDVILVLDGSDTISDKDLEAIKHAAKSFVKTVLDENEGDNNNKIGVINYASSAFAYAKVDEEAGTLEFFTDDIDTLFAAIDDLGSFAEADAWYANLDDEDPDKGYVVTTDSANLVDALVDAAILFEYEARPESDKSLVVMTDGIVDNPAEAYRITEKEFEEVDKYMVGFYHDMDPEMKQLASDYLKLLAGDNGTYVEVDEPYGLDPAFVWTANQILGNDAAGETGVGGPDTTENPKTGNSSTSLFIIVMSVSGLAALAVKKAIKSK
ncbi:MAG: VWA domain-containing protein [Oscillospiraceae bacterium]|jgi:hypothetical protein|nr:VWA domain-containing protein [Oscillospiraceae bacterium]